MLKRKYKMLLTLILLSLVSFSALKSDITVENSFAKKKKKTPDPIAVIDPMPSTETAEPIATNPTPISDQINPMQPPSIESIPESSVNFGIYDPEHEFDNVPLAFDHHFISWSNEAEIATIPTWFNEAAKNYRWMLLTIEPHPINYGANLFDEIKEGLHDKNIQTICQSIETSRTPVFIRWGHEMENLIGRYPWETTSPEDYIEGYNYFVSKCKAFTNNAYYVWSPVGNDNLNLYWPGEQNVDYVGLSLYIFDQIEYKYYGKIRNFDEAFLEKYSRVNQYNKPIIIAEMGIEDSIDQRAWWEYAVSNLYKYPLLKSIVYFDMVDHPEVWGSDVDTPNWSIDNKTYPYLSN